MKNIKKVILLALSIIFIGVGYLEENHLFQLFMIMVGASLVAYLLYDKCYYEEKGLSVKVIALIILSYFIILVCPVYYLADKTSIKMWYVTRFFRERSTMIMAVFVILVLFGAIRIVRIYNKEYVQKILLIMCAILVSISCWQNSKIYIMRLGIGSEKQKNIRIYNKIFSKVINNVEQNNIDDALQGLEDMYILGEQIDYTVGTNQAQKLPLYLREVLTGQQGKMLQEDEKKQIKYANVDDKERIKYFLDITTHEYGNAITERSSQQLGKALEGERKDTFFYVQGGRKWVKDEIKDFKLNMDEAMQHTMDILQVNQRYKDYIEVTSWEKHS